MNLFGSFNPYFSGFRSYTIIERSKTMSNIRFQSLFQWIPVLYGALASKVLWLSTVSILISVDSGLIQQNIPD